jgi:hypothetical protein
MGQLSRGGGREYEGTIRLSVFFSMDVTNFLLMIILRNLAFSMSKYMYEHLGSHCLSNIWKHHLVDPGSS